MIRTTQKKFKHLFDYSLLAAMATMVVLLYSISLAVSPEDVFTELLTTSVKKQESSPTITAKETLNLTRRINYSRECLIDDLFEKHQTEILNIKGCLEIPRVFATHLPSKLGIITNIKNKQEIFVETLLPHILKHNEEILADRTYLLRLKRTVDGGNSLSFEQRLWLGDLAERYHVKQISFEELLKRVDIIPPSLAIGQAVVESGWGGCKYARKQNSPFGLMKDQTRLMTFSSLYEGVKMYMDTLNKHPAYESLRRIRAQHRLEGSHPCSIKLADGLLYYSTRRKAYTHQLKHIINVHSFKKYDHARLTSDLRS